MWSLSIGNIKALAWLKDHAKHLRTSVMVFAVLILVNVLVFAFLLSPLSSRLKTGEQRSIALRKRHAEAVLFEKQKPHFTGIMSGIPAQKDMPLLVKEVVQTARKSNLSVAAVNYDIPQRESGELAMLAFSFPAEGKYPDLKRFVYDVETSDRLIGIQDLKLEMEKNSVKLQMKLMTYVRGK
jgi:Tfp pilus assembly protein PilO